MYRRGTIADNITYSTLIHGFCQVGDFVDARDIFKDMISNGVCLDTITFRNMLAGLCSKEELQKAVAMLEDLQKSEGYQLEDE
ncbi:Pentatricopeptide repeat-containing protein [Cardamine amara subsp. amara]|uniref:Pentatricopeptide repeat-containing protein n=1 Tax=Cardamine amara subsp. amara TaxID=228776 RepID=A0ABD0Z0M3_CARAN